MISPAAAELIRRAKKQVGEGLDCVLRDEYEMARVWFHAALASMDALEAHLNAPEHRPLRKMALVVMPPQDGEEEPLPEWFARKANDNGGDGAA